MIIGIGTDILKIERLQAAYDRTQGRLAEKILGPDEMLVFKARLARNHKRGYSFPGNPVCCQRGFLKSDWSRHENANDLEIITDFE